MAVDEKTPNPNDTKPRKFRFKFSRRVTTVVEIEANSWEEAHRKADGMVVEEETEVGDWCYDSSRQICGPWVRATRYLDNNIIVCDLPNQSGDAFTERDIEELRKRIEAVGYEITDFWNGVGCSTVSFQIGGDGVGELTPEEEASIEAPRPYTETPEETK